LFKLEYSAQPYTVASGRAAVSDKHCRQMHSKYFVGQCNDENKNARHVIASVYLIRSSRSLKYKVAFQLGPTDVLIGPRGQCTFKVRINFGKSNQIY